MQKSSSNTSKTMKSKSQYSFKQQFSNPYTSMENVQTLKLLNKKLDVKQSLEKKKIEKKLKKEQQLEEEERLRQQKEKEDQIVKVFGQEEEEEIQKQKEIQEKLKRELQHNKVRENKINRFVIKKREKKWDQSFINERLDIRITQKDKPQEFKKLDKLFKNRDNNDHDFQLTQKSILKKAKKINPNPNVTSNWAPYQPWNRSFINHQLYVRPVEFEKQPQKIPYVTQTYGFKFYAVDQKIFKPKSESTHECSPELKALPQNYSSLRNTHYKNQNNNENIRYQDDQLQENNENLQDQYPSQQQYNNNNEQQQQDNNNFQDNNTGDNFQQNAQQNELSNQRQQQQNQNNNKNINIKEQDSQTQLERQQEQELEKERKIQQEILEQEKLRENNTQQQKQQ